MEGCPEPPAPNRMTEPAPLDDRRRRVRFRAWHRGMREVDLLLGRFADAHLARLSDAELGALEALMEVPDDQLYSWLVGRVAPAAEHKTPLFDRIVAHHQDVHESR
jgi:antitoxin CptB